MGNINPLRAFDCKEEGCKHVMDAAPKITDYLCDDCKEHHTTVKSYLDAAGINYTEDHKLVRGLDYYTRTVFEVQALDSNSAQNAVGGGGRYDKLCEEVGGRPTPGFGFALGFERCAHRHADHRANHALRTRHRRGNRRRLEGDVHRHLGQEP